MEMNLEMTVYHGGNVVPSPQSRISSFIVRNIFSFFTFIRSLDLTWSHVTILVWICSVMGFGLIGFAKCFAHFAKIPTSSEWLLAEAIQLIDFTFLGSKSNHFSDGMGLPPALFSSQNPSWTRLMWYHLKLSSHPFSNISKKKTCVSIVQDRRLVKTNEKHFT